MGPTATERSLMMLEDDIEQGESTIRRLDVERREVEDPGELRVIEERMEVEMRRVHELEQKREELVEEILKKEEYPYR